jgi:GNAT superfamily N-acetyltransferase
MSAWSGSLPPPGEERSEFIEEKGMLLRHGSSLALMALVSTALNGSDEFEEVDPEEDWKTWTERRPEMKLHYAALLDPARDGPDAVACILRAVLDPLSPGRSSGCNRIIIDYITTRKAFRGRGLASAAVSFVEQAAAATLSNCYVLALEDSCTYWMGKGFVLESSKRLTARLNVFPDTHLLRRSADPLDDGEPSDDGFLAARRELEEQSDGSDSSESEDEDDGIALASALSLLASHPNAAERDASRALLLKAATNLQNDPSNPKFRRLRKANKTIDAKVVRVKGAAEVLACMGFEDQGDEWVADDDVWQRAAAVAGALKM